MTDGVPWWFRSASSFSSVFPPSFPCGFQWGGRAPPFQQLTTGPWHLNEASEVPSVQAAPLCMALECGALGLLMSGKVTSSFHIWKIREPHPESLLLHLGLMRVLRVFGVHFGLWNYPLLSWTTFQTHKGGKLFIMTPWGATPNLASIITSHCDSRDS